LEEIKMAVYSIWESYFPPEATGEGQKVTKLIWEDMTRFEGYLGHELLYDLDDPGHLLVVSRWDTQERADEVLAEHADHPNAVDANRLVDRPRRRFAAIKLSPG
jgi:quinol monooxygenase YgiN